MSAQLWTVAPLMALAMSQFDLPPPEPIDAETGSEISLPLTESDAQQISLERIIIVRIPRFEVQSEAVRSKGNRELKSVDCIAADTVKGVKPTQIDTLDLLTTKGHYRAVMPQGCDARQFYSGFYMEKPRDGRLCTNRDELHSRSGMTCEIEAMHEVAR